MQEEFLFLKDNFSLEYIDNILHFDGTPLSKLPVTAGALNNSSIVKDIETPFFLYSMRHIKNRCYDYLQCVSRHKMKAVVCYALKANMNLSILKEIAKCGLGADVTSLGELKRAVAAGFDTKKIIFSGVGKTKAEIVFAIEKEILQFNVESVNELFVINQIATSCQKVVNIAIRVNPNIDAHTNDKISTGREGDKFGIDISRIDEVLNIIKSLQNIKLTGFAIHVGSQILDINVFEKTFIALRSVYDMAIAKGFDITILDVGGGLGVCYSVQDKPINLEHYFQLIDKYLPSSVIKIFEPGRYIVANSSILIADIIYVKQERSKSLAILNTGMNNLLRPALYGAKHQILPLIHGTAGEKQFYDFVGPICETSDIFVQDAYCQRLHDGDKVVILSVGAYGYSMSNFYNGRCLLPELILIDNKIYLTRNKIELEELSFADSFEEL